MIQAECHCGNVKLTANYMPASVTSCNCSICNRLGALWAYYEPECVEIEFRESPTLAYTWGDRDIEFHHCTICGCATHYQSAEKCKDKRVAINACMMEPASIAHIPVREFDGAVSWKYLNE